MIDPADIEDFLAAKRIAVVGASDDRKNFARTIYRELRQHGYDVVPVNTGTSSVDGDPCYPDLAAVPGDVDGVLVMVHRDRAESVVADCVAHGVNRVWLFKGIGGTGSVSDHGRSAVPPARDPGHRGSVPDDVPRTGRRRSPVPIRAVRRLRSFTGEGVVTASPRPGHRKITVHLISLTQAQWRACHGAVLRDLRPWSCASPS